MTTLEDLYIYYCRRCDCKPNTRLASELRSAYEAAGEQRLLEKIDLSQNYVGPKGIAPVLELARNIHNLNLLDARNNFLEDNELAMVVKALAKHPSVQSVDLGNNRLTEHSVPQILHLLNINTNIVELRLGGNQLLPESMQRIDEALQANHAEQKRLREEAAALSSTGEENAVLRPKYLPHKSAVEGTLTTANSGGHFHFASWRRNPQYQMYLSTNALVRISLRIRDPNPTKQFGFAVLKGKGLVKMIEVDPSDILAESPFDDQLCHVTIRLNAANRNRCDGPYLIIPFSFQPQRPGSFTIECEVVDEPGQGSIIEQGAFVSVEPLDSRYDWEINEISGVWNTDNAGGSSGHASWRDNAMYHLQYRGTAAARHIASLYIVLTKSNDEDINDERRIGLYLVKKSPNGPPGAPVLLTEENVVQCVNHERKTSVVMKVEASCGSMDWYVIPTTQEPGSFGPYTLTVFSTCQISLAPQLHPHGWCYHFVEGVWDQQRNGGCRRDNVQSWIHNPSYLFQYEGKATMALTISLEVLPEAASSLRPSTGTASNEPIEVQLMLLEYNIEDFGPLKISSFGRVGQEAVLSLNHLPAGNYVLVATTKRAGQHGTFRIRAFTEYNVFLSKEAVLSARIRETQLENYATDNEQRRTHERAAIAQATASNAVAGELVALEPESVAATLEKEAVIKEYLATGRQHTDRDFPRGESSLWLGIAQPPSWAPNVFAWRRPTELVVDEPIAFAPQWTVDQVRLGSGFDNDWVMSALSLVSLRPAWLARVARGGYDPTYGIAQFSFFKNGQWHAVTIDDYLPVDNLNELSFSSSATRRNDFFIPLFEKAYAKFHRCYEALDGRVGSALGLTTQFREALMDLTGGLCWVYDVQEPLEGTEDPVHGPFNTTSSAPPTMAAEAQSLDAASLWTLLKTFQDEDRIMGLCLHKDSINSLEKQHVGIVRDRLYAVADVRSVEGRQLVKLQQFWPENDAVRPFCGKWATGSSLWTPLMQHVVDYKPSSRAVWMSLEEVQYYFSSLYVIKKYQHATYIEGGFSPEHAGGPIQNDTWVENPQYTLDLLRDGEEAALQPLTVTVGIHQRDGRVTLTREAETSLSYATEIGLTLFLTHDNTRRLATLSPNEYVVHSTTVRGRDVFLTLTIDPTAYPNAARVILMPYITTPKLAMQVFLSVWNDTCPTAVSLIQASTRTVCEGEWRAGNSGGPPLSGTWRNNPQFHLYPSEGMEVTIVLRQRNDLSSTEDYIGFTVHRATGVRSLLHYDENEVVLSVGHQNGHAVAGTLRVAGMQERRGMPYIVVPSTSKANVETGFTLEVIANRKVHLCRIPAETDWKTLIFPVSLKYIDRNTGGSFRFSSWRNNPQYLLNFPLEREGDVLVNVTNHSVSDDTEIAVNLVRPDAWDYGRRRKISITPEDMIAGSGERAHTAELRTTVAVKSSSEPILLIPYAATPLSEVNLTVSVYAAMDIEVDVVQEWYTEVVDGSWELGLTAGGNRAQNRTWSNNPYFHVNLTRQTRLTAVLLQYPRGPEKPMVKRVGKNRAFLPPPITNPQNKINIGLDVTQSDEDMTQVSSTKHTYDGEVSLDIVLPACTTTPYVFVPHSFEPEQEADFKLMIFADQPFQVTEIKKTRHYY